MKKDNSTLIVISVIMISLVVVGLLTVTSFLVYNNLKKDNLTDLKIEEKLELDLNNSIWVSEKDTMFEFFNNEFRWYQSIDNVFDNYYSGNFQVMRGEEAYNYLTTELNEYGITKNELDNYFERNSNSDDYNLDNLIYLELTNESVMIDGKVEDMNNQLSHYFGYVIDYESSLDIVNMNTGTKLLFHLEEYYK